MNTVCFAGTGVLAMAAAAAAQTVVPGGNITNHVWTAANSPYIVMGDIVVPAGAYLVLEPGVEVRFAPSDATGSGLDPLRVELTIHGSLTINGTVSSPVLLSAQNGVAGSWHGVTLQPGCLDATLEHTTVSGARRAIVAHMPGDVLQCSNLSVTDFVLSGIEVRAGLPTLGDLVLTGAPGAVGLDVFPSTSPELESAIISGCDAGLRWESARALNLSRLEVRGFTSVGAEVAAPLTVERGWFQGTGAAAAGIIAPEVSIATSMFTGCGTAIDAGEASVRFCTIVGNAVGGIRVASSDSVIANSIIANNGQFGIQALSLLSPTVRMCDVFTPGGTSFIGAFCTEGCISADPQLLAGALPRLAPGSPCIDAGDTFGEVDYFFTLRPHEGDGMPGTFSDMGMYELPCPANCDRSIAWPVLNVADFTCFLQRFAAGDPYANCDESTQPPVLNVADFTCFLGRFAAGCP